MRYSEGMEGRYPPVHKYLLAVAYVPTVAYHWWQGELPSSDGDWRSELPLRTSLIRVGRLVTVVMGVGVLLLLYRLGQMLGPPGAGLLAAGLWAGMYSTAYYSLTTNADLPYLFWWLLAVYGIVLAHRGGGRWALVLSAVAAALAVGTKDQAAGLAMPLAVMLLWRVDAVAAGDDEADVTSATLAGRLRMLGLWLAVAAGVYLLVTQAIIRPGNYWEHVQTLFSDALVPYQEENGLVAVASRYAKSAATMAHPLLGILLLIGAVVAIGRRPALVGWLCLPALSFTLLFIVPSRLVAARFLLPHAATASLVAGIGGVILLSRLGTRTQHLAISAAVLACFTLSIGLHLMLWQDSREAADRWLANHPQVSQSLGTYCTNDAHLPIGAQQAEHLKYATDGGAGQPAHTYLIFCEGLCYQKLTQQTDVHARQHWQRLLDGHAGYQLVQVWQPVPMPWLWSGLNTRPLDVPALRQTLRLYARQTDPQATMPTTKPADPAE